MSASPEPHPSDLVEPEQLLRLADEYRQAADTLFEFRRSGDSASSAPYRYAAAHAIELYLNALLLHAGHAAPDLRGLRHDLSARVEKSEASGLVLRRKTAAHLRAMTDGREYLVARYVPEPTSPLSPLNRLAATLKEVAAKVGRVMREPRRAAA